MKRRVRRGERSIEAVAGGEPLPAGKLDDPDDAEMLRAAIVLKGGQPAADLPSAEFVARLRMQVADERAGIGQHRVGRRALLGAAGAVAAGTAGVALDRAVFQGGPTAARSQAELEPDDGRWLGVASEGELADGVPRRFDTGALIGFVTGTPSGVVAVSAACTHLGCILQANTAAARFDCPCHRTAFAHDGRLLFAELPTPPAPLTRLQVRRREGAVEVFVPPAV